MKIYELLAEADDKSSDSEIKANIKAVIDSLHMEFPSAEGSGHYSKPKTLIRKKSLAGGSVGPMTSSNAHITKSESVQKKVENAFEKIEGVQFDYSPSYLSDRLKNLKVIIPLGKKSKVINFRWEMFPAYTGSDYDPAYENMWYVMDTK